jgi:hypothetical protein
MMEWALTQDASPSQLSTKAQVDQHFHRARVR